MEPALLTNSPPRVSFSTLAKLMGPSTPVKVAGLLREHKYPSHGPKLSYRTARQQLIDLAVSQVPLNPLAPTRKHEREAINAMLQYGVPLPNGFTCSVPRAHAPHWSFHGVEIAVFPELDLTSASGSGAFKAYFAKDKLARGVGSTMATLIHYYKTRILGQPNVRPQQCILWEVRSGAQFSAGNSSKLLANAEMACQLIAALWPTL